MIREYLAPGQYAYRAENVNEGRLATINRLCNLAPDDDGEVFEPMTDAELDAMAVRMATSPEASF